jgi:hypothetical protein
MKCQITLIVSFLILNIFHSKAFAQLSLSIDGCNNLLVASTPNARATMQDHCTYVLEKMTTPGIWESMHKKFEISNTTSFLKVSYGTYRVKLVINSNLAGTVSLPVFSNIVEVRDCNTKKSFVALKTSPNPAIDNLNVTISSFEGEEIFVLYDIMGLKVKSANFSGTQLTISIETLPPGIYFAIVELNATSIARQKIVIK